MRNKPLKGLVSRSPFKTDTKLADRVYRKDKVDATLRGRGEHTEGALRGTKDTTPKGNASAGNNQMMNPGI
jgi:hypothetical protein